MLIFYGETAQNVWRYLCRIGRYGAIFQGERGKFNGPKLGKSILISFAAFCCACGQPKSVSAKFGSDKVAIDAFARTFGAIVASSKSNIGAELIERLKGSAKPCTLAEFCQNIQLEEKDIVGPSGIPRNAFVGARSILWYHPDKDYRFVDVLFLYTTSNGSPEGARVIESEFLIVDFGE